MNDPLGLFGDEQNTQDPLGLFEDSKPKAGLGTAIKTSFANVGNVADLAASTLAGSAAALFGDDEEARAIYENMEARRKMREQWANPDQQELTFGGKVAGTLATLPMQVLTGGLQPAETTRTALAAGETPSKAVQAGMIDAAGNLVGIALPGWKEGGMLVRGATGAVANVGQEFATRKAIQGVLETEQGKAAFEPTTEDLAVSGIVGGGFGVALGRKVPKASTKAQSILQQQQAKDATAPAPVRPDLTNETTQLELFDQPEQGRVPMQFEATPGDWRIDENGMPVRVDLSLEAQNLQNPLQRNLWGDELDVQVPRDPGATLPMDRDIMGYPRMTEPSLFKGDLENQRPLTEAIDDMGWAKRRGALKSTKMGRELEASGELQGAVTRAEALDWLTQNERPEAAKERFRKTGFAKKQGGGVLMDPFGRVPESSDKLQDLLKTVPYRFQSLETLPNKDFITAENIRQIMGRQEVTAAEKQIIRGAFTEASILSDTDRISARTFADALEQVIQDYRLFPEKTERFADYGIDALGRRTGSESAPIETWPWVDQLRMEALFNDMEDARAKGQEDMVQYYADQITRLDNKYKQPGVDTSTNIWTSSLDLPELVGKRSTHFTSPDYIGHTRSFTENGVKHVVEIQSDLLQRAKGVERLEPLQKNWAVRLIREELAQAAKNNEPIVRFATADTVAKVEGWEDFLQPLREELKSAIKEKKRLEELSSRDPSFNTIFEDQISAITSRIEALGNRYIELEKAGNRFDPQHQGIYDRYNKEVAKYLISIGGKTIVDDKGVSWIEVPVEASRRRPIMFGQRGVLKIDWSDVNKAENSLYKSEDGTYIPRNPNVQQAITDSLKAGKDIDVVQWLQSGATSVAMKTKNPVIRAAEDIVQNAGKRSDLTIRQHVLPAENAARKLNAQELIDLAEIFKDEMFTGRRIDGNILAENFSVKQLEAYTQFRDMFDKTLDAQNAVRVAQGKKPISAKEAYLSSRWEGDFRQPVYDKDGNLVWYLASNTKPGLKTQINALKKQFPDLVIDEAKQRTIRSNQRTTDIESAYSIMLDLLGRDNPEVIRMQQFMEELQQVEGEKTLGQTKHFKSKGNVRGFVGDRPGKGGKSEAAAMLQQQIQYAKNAFKWSEMQRASADIKEIISNPDLNTQQPNTVKYVRDYFKNALGFGEARVFSELNNAVREMGVSPNVVAKAVGDMKSLFIAQKLMLSAGYTAANMIQTSNVLPYLTDLRNQGVKGNFISAITNGIGGGLAMTASHYGRLAGMLEYDNVPMMLPFWKDAFRYAEDNGITARSIIDESPIDSSRAMRVGSYTLSAPETIVRSIAFMTYAEFLRSSGKYSDMQKLFQEAERLTNKSMVDYRETERPLVFGKAGTVGNFLNTLQTFPISFYNQYAYMVKQAMDGKPAGLITMLAMQYMLAGAMGIPYVQDMERLFEYIRDNWTSDETFAKMMDSEFLSSPRLWLIEHLSASGVYGALSTETGVGFTSRVAAPNPSEMLQSPVGPVTDIAGQIGAVGKALTSPNEVNLAQAAMKTVPVGLQGLLETAPFMEGITYDTREDGTQVFRKSSDLTDQQAVIARTPEEVAVRKWGLRSQREVMERDVTFRAKSAAKAAKDRAATLPDKILNAAKAGDVGKVNELTALYTKLTGQGISNTQLENQIKEAYLTDLERYRAKKTLSPMEAMRMARLQKILEENK